MPVTTRLISLVPLDVFEFFPLSGERFMVLSNFRPDSVNLPDYWRMCYCDIGGKNPVIIEHDALLVSNFEVLHVATVQNNEVVPF